MPTTLADIDARVASVCAGAPFGFVQAQDPFSFVLQPSGQIDQVFRIEAADVSVVGGTSYSETRIGQLRIFVARTQGADPTATRRTLLTDLHSLTAAITRDGVTGGGDYDVSDAGRGSAVQHDPGKAFAVGRLTLPVSYDATV